MSKENAMEEFKKMWLWLYRHPAHDKNYYVKHVAKPSPPWDNDCPLCSFVDDQCTECLVIWDSGEGTLCSDPASPLAKWKDTDINEPHRRTWYAGELMALTEKSTS